MVRVVIDAGHGGSQPGATNDGVLEKNITLDIAKKVQTWLMPHPQISVVLTRSDDKDVSLAKRVAFAGDCFVSIHCNAGGGRGLETYHQTTKFKADSKQLAEDVHYSILRNVNFQDRGIKTKTKDGIDYYYVLQYNNKPAILVECGFIDDPRDFAILTDPNKRNAIAYGIAKGIEGWLKRKGLIA